MGCCTNGIIVDSPFFAVTGVEKRYSNNSPVSRVSVATTAELVIIAAGGAGAGAVDGMAAAFIRPALKVRAPSASPADGAVRSASA